ncbi:1595_t:CDS:2 [Acaulospora colombiana]|uniref:1595_t:CDS:1 n=1 Tax=Acaulospora colombiana TaxID=27376 RepID=A0ACA9KKS8_9GLOM|nr:1595_t:CDS:2 [Acaulospora colombiana]
MRGIPFFCPTSYYYEPQVEELEILSTGVHGENNESKELGGERDVNMSKDFEREAEGIESTAEPARGD